MATAFSACWSPKTWRAAFSISAARWAPSAASACCWRGRCSVPCSSRFSRSPCARSIPAPNSAVEADWPHCAMQIASHHLRVATRGKGLYEITGQIAAWLESARVRAGLLTVFVQHTSASLTIQENADPDVVLDLNTFFNRLVPEDSRLYRHTVERPDDMPA